MKYRIYPEPIDVIANSPEAAIESIKYMEGHELSVVKCLPVDKDGFVINQNG